jgi:hypothetical protein
MILEIVDALKKNGYEVDEFEHKGDRVRSNVKKGEWLSNVANIFQEKLSDK